VNTLADAVARLAPETARAWTEALENYAQAAAASDAAREVLYANSVRRTDETVPQWMLRCDANRAAWHSAIEVAQAAWIAVPYDARRLWVEMGVEQLLAELRARAGVTA
jgi:hypothetical protein